MAYFFGLFVYFSPKLLISHTHFMYIYFSFFLCNDFFKYCDSFFENIFFNIQLFFISEVYGMI